MMPRQSLLLKILLPLIVFLTGWLLLHPAGKSTQEPPRPAPWQR